MISPTNRGIRNDGAGAGHWGALRHMRRHKGVDYLCTPGQEVIAPCDMQITRIAYPYGDHSYSGIAFRTLILTGKLFYFEPDIEVMDRWVMQGQRIGIAQDISLRYPDLSMRPHVHLEINSIDPEAR